MTQLSSELSFTGVHHVRVPVSDLAASRTFWEATFGYTWDFDFPGDTGPRATALQHPRGGPSIVLWLDPELARRSAGFTLFGIGLPSRSDVEALRIELDRQGIRNGGIQSAFVDVKLPYVETPDGQHVGFYVKPERQGALS